MISSESLDVINQLLRQIHFRSEVFYRGQVCDSWSLDTSGSGNVNFHMICHGQCWLHLPGNAQVMPLQTGDVVVFPDDAVHIISSSTTTPDKFGIQQITKQVGFDKSADGTALVCGYLIIDKLVRKLLLNGLPPYIVINSSTAPINVETVKFLLDLIFNEASQNSTGASAILDRLADALLFYIVRDLIHNNVSVPGLLGILGDEKITKSVYAVSLNPGKHWTLDLLADSAHLSRSVFNERFIQACGMAPMEFITLWRMYSARRWLEQDRATVLDVAERCGYLSAASFSKAFKRVIGVGPGQIRKLGNHTG